MKKIIFIFLLFPIVTVSFIGCGKDDDEDWKREGFSCDCDYITYSKNPQVGYSSWVETFRSTWSGWLETDNDCRSYQLDESQSLIGGQTWYSKTMIECDKVPYSW